MSNATLNRFRTRLSTELFGYFSILDITKLKNYQKLSDSLSKRLVHLKINLKVTYSLLYSSSVPTPRVRIMRTPSTGVHTSTRLNLTCITELSRWVDTPMTVTYSWRGPSGSISPRSSSRPSVYGVTQFGEVYQSSIFFSSGMRTSDSGTYYCRSSTSSASSYIVTSGSVQVSTSVSVGMFHCITVKIQTHAL